LNKEYRFFFLNRFFNDEHLDGASNARTQMNNYTWQLSAYVSDGLTDQAQHNRDEGFSNPSAVARLRPQAFGVS